nr:MAG TPA: hypothetical protein [Caudoviricetes sp.]
MLSIMIMYYFQQLINLFNIHGKEDVYEEE